MEIKTAPITKKLEPERWDRLKSILEEALQETTAEGRTALVQRRCREDAFLLGEAESLLAEAESLRAEPTDWLEGCADQATRTFWDDELSRNGERIGAYAISRQLGRGGMGAVYLAARADGQFEKQVAIKVLKRGTDTDEILHRFTNERQIVARLDHPNIARLLDAGTTDDGLPYFVMEFVAGVPATQFVREQQLSITARLELFLKICAAVEVAHQAGVVHRDLKPSNILVTAELEPKLLDFGIAKLLEPGGDAADVTATGRQHFTPNAASPEQARGDSVTCASDVYALGALLYEMLTESTPHRFSSAYPMRDEVVRVIGEEAPAFPSLVAFSQGIRRQLKGDLDNIVLYAMRKEPGQRYPSVAEFAEDIRRHLQGGLVKARRATVSYRLRQFVARNQLLTPRSLATAAILLVVGGMVALLLGGSFLRRSSARSAPDVLERQSKSIAVLPFENLSGEAENAFFAIGVQDAILSDLGKVTDLKVISRTSVAQYTSDHPRDARAIGRQLGVAHLLEGSVQRAGNRVRVTATLIDARSDGQIWAEKYDRELADVFAMQSEIAQTIVRQLQAKLLPREKAEMELPPTRDLAAYNLFLQAKEIIESYLDAADPKVSLLQAIRFLEEAVRRDPNFTVAYCYGARAHSIIWGLGLDSNGQARMQQAEAALERAFHLQPDSAEAHLANAELYYRFGLQLALAEGELAIAEPHLPNSSPFYILAGNIYRRQGQWDEAERVLAKAVELDPRNVNAINFLADTQILRRNFAGATTTYERARRIGLDSPILSVRIAVIDFSATGRTDNLEAALAAAPADLDVGGGETPLRVMLALRKQDYDGAARVLAASPRQSFQDIDFSFYYPRSWYEAVIARAQGNEEKAKIAFAEAGREMKARLEGMPLHARTDAVQAQIYAGLGLKEAAIEEALAAAKRRPIELDAFDGPLVLQGLAQVYTWTGEPERALGVLEILLKYPGYLCYGTLLDPSWEPLRGTKQFQEIVAALAPP